MIALVFLYLTASIFIFGGELNAAILRARLKPIGDDCAGARAIGCAPCPQRMLQCSPWHCTPVCIHTRP